MRRVYILLFCILLAGFIAKPCWGEEQERYKLDGYKWDSWPRDGKFGWVKGYCDGLDRASLEGAFFLSELRREMGNEMGENEFESKERGLKGVESFIKRLVLSGVTYGQMVDGLDKFYQDYRNKKVLTREAIWIVKLQVKGAPQDFIDQEARILRMPTEERGKEWLNLRLKNQVYREAWEKWRDQIPATLHW